MNQLQPNEAAIWYSPHAREWFAYNARGELLARGADKDDVAAAARALGYTVVWVE